MTRPLSYAAARASARAGLVVLALGLGGLVLLAADRFRPGQAQPLVTGVYAVGPAGLQVIDVSDPARPAMSGDEKGLAPGIDVAVHPGGLAAYVATDDSWAIVDVRDPRAPSIVDRRPLDGRRASIVHVAEDRLFVVTVDPRSQASSVLIHSIGSPMNPVQIGRLDLTQSILGIGVRGTSLYVATGTILVAYDIADPTMPQLTGRLARKAVGIAVDAARAYVIETSGLAVVDLTDPAHPAELGFVDLGQSEAVSVAPLRTDSCDESCGRAVVGTQLLPTGGGGGMVVVDVSVPAQPSVMGGASAGMNVPDLVSAGGWLFAAHAGRGFGLYRTDPPPALPRLTGQLAGDLVAVAVGPEDEQPTATPTATERGPTATDTPTNQPTRTGTAEQPTATPTPTSTRPPRTPPPGTVWETHGAESGPVGLDTVRFVREDGDGRIWIRRQRPDGGPDQVVEVRAGYVVIHDTVKAAVEARTPDIVKGGSIPDLWSVDRDDNVWVGPEYYDGAFWHTLAIDEIQPGGQLVHEQRALLDANGRAWVPFGAVVDCPDPAGCRQAGIRVFGQDALERTVPLDVVPEAAGMGVRNVQLVGGAGAIVVAQGGAEGWVVGQRALILTPDGESKAYPRLEESGGAAQNSGYATAATMRGDGSLQVFTWIEIHDDRPDLAWQILANTWDGSSWDVWDLTGECPLVHDSNTEFLRVTAAAYGPDDTLWVGSSLGEVAVWRAGTWIEHFTPQNSPLLDGRPVTDIMITDLGAAWIVQPGQLLTYGEPGELEFLVRAYGPYSEQR